MHDRKSDAGLGYRRYGRPTSATAGLLVIHLFQEHNYFKIEYCTYRDLNELTRTVLSYTELYRKNC